LSNYRAHELNKSLSGRKRQIVVANVRNEKISSANSQPLESTGKKVGDNRARNDAALARVNKLREAYEKALDDRDLIAEGRNGRVELESFRGEELEALVRKVMEQPPVLIARTQQLSV